MSAVNRIRSLIASEPTFYSRLWTTSINIIGVVIVAAVLFDISVVLGEGETGIFRRALYPLGPPALTLGAGLAELDRRHIAISGSILFGYVGLLALVGTLGEALSASPAYVIGGAVGVCMLMGVGWVLERRRRRVENHTS